MHVGAGIKDLVVNLTGGENLGHGGGDQQRLVLDGIRARVLHFFHTAID